MTFIVEMVWGRPHEIVVYDLDAEGELMPSHTITDAQPRDPEWRHFSCHAGVWERVLELGRSAGWIPNGTSPAEGTHEAWNKAGGFENSYEPESWGYHKLFEANDAASLADALQRVLDSDVSLGLMTREPKSMLLRDGMTQTEFSAANQSLSPQFLRDFIAFLRKGCFVFGWDD